MPIGIRTEGLRKVYPAAQQRGDVVALDGLTLEVQPGEIFGLLVAIVDHGKIIALGTPEELKRSIPGGYLGPNGAGKSTTVGIVTTRVQPTAGRAWVGDLDVWKNSKAVKRLIGVVPQRPNLDFALTAREILTFHGAYFGLSSEERRKRADALLEQFKLTDRANQKPLGFSGGMMQRLSIARAMMHDPDVLFLDEPSAGLDPQTRLLLSEMIRGYNARGKTILLTTHNMEEADSLCHRGRPAAGRPDVQHGHGTDDLLRLHVLPMDGAGQVPHPQARRAYQSFGICQRGLPQRPRATGATSPPGGHPGRTGGLRHGSPPLRPSPVPAQGSELMYLESPPSPILGSALPSRVLNLGTRFT